MASSKSGHSSLSSSFAEPISPSFSLPGSLNSQESISNEDANEEESVCEIKARFLFNRAYSLLNDLNLISENENYFSPYFSVMFLDAVGCNDVHFFLPYYKLVSVLHIDILLVLFPIITKRSMVKQIFGCL